MNDEKAKLNYSLGHLLIEDFNTVKITCDDIISINPQCVDAYAFLLDTYPIDKHFDEIILYIPVNLRDNSTILFGLGMVQFKKGNYIEAIELIEKSIEKNPEKFEYKALLGNILLTEALNKELILGYDEYKIEKSKKALNLYNEAIEKIQNKEIIKYKGIWYVHRGTAKGNLNDTVGAIEDLKIALQYNPNDDVAANNLALSYRENNENEKAINLLENFNNPKFEHRKILLGEFYRIDGNFKKAKESYQYVIDVIKNPKLVYEAKKLLVVALQQNGENEEARKINDELQRHNKDDILLLLNQSEILIESGEEDKAKNVLRHAFKAVDDVTNTRYIKLLANALHDSRIYNEASILLRRISSIDSIEPAYDAINRKLINCYIKTNKYNNALEMCKKLRPLFPDNDQLVEIETYIYERTGDLQSAYNVYVEYFKYNNNDLEMLVRFAGLNMRNGNYSELDEFLNADIDYSKLNLEMSIYLVQLYDIRNIQDRFLNLLYDMRKRFYNEAQAHSAFITLMMQSGEKYKYLIDVDMVNVDTVVTLKKGNTIKYYILENIIDADISKREVYIASELGKKLKDKTVGDIVELTDNPYGNDQYEIIEIKSKYLHALNESMDEFNEFFPEDKSVVKITFDPDAGVKPILEKMFSDDDENRKATLTLNDQYKRGSLTIGILSNYLKRDYFEVFVNLAMDAQMGIIVANGTEIERKLGSSFLTSNRAIVLDLTSINTLVLLEINKPENYVKFIVVQSLKDELSTILIKRKGIGSVGFSAVSKVGKDFVRDDISKEQIDKQITYIEKILEWVEDNCEVASFDAEYLSEEAKFEDNLLNLGTSFIHSIILARQLNAILFTDDFGLRMLAKNDYGIDGIWSQIILQDFLSKKIIDNEQYNKYIVKLLSYNYKHLVLNYKILIEAAKESNWSPVFPFNVVIGVLNGSNEALHLATRVATDFIFDLWQQIISNEKRNSLLFQVLENLTKGKNIAIVIEVLSIEIKIKFKFLPFALEEIIDIISKWYSIRIK